MLRLVLLVCLLPLVSPSFTAKDMLSAPRSSPAIPNPNGTLAVYTQSTYSFDTDSHTGGIFLLPISAPSNSTSESSRAPKLLVNSTDASGPIWLDNSTILYIVTKSGESSLHTLDLDSDKETKVQTFHGAVGDLKSLRLDDDTVRIVFSAKVTPHGEIVRANESSTPEVLVYDRLWVRHWDEWITPNRNTLFSGTLKRSKRGHYSVQHYPKNMLNSTDDIHDLESPVPPFGGTEDFDISTTHLAFVAKDPHLNPATNTASHVYIVSFNDSTYLEKVNSGPGASSSPVWSPDGKYLAYLEMRVPGYEADRTTSPLPQKITNSRTTCRGIYMGNPRKTVHDRRLGP